MSVKKYKKPFVTRLQALEAATVVLTRASSVRHPNITLDRCLECLQRQIYSRERPMERRQSGVVEADGEPATEGALATLARTWDVKNI